MNCCECRICLKAEVATGGVNVAMLHSSQLERYVLPLVGALILLVVWLPTSATADAVERMSVNVVVIDAETNQPISQAHLTLQFVDPGSVRRLKRHKHISFNAKTNAQGRYRFTNIPKGTIRLLVTAERHQSLGKEIELDKDNQVIEVKLRKPQPLL